MPTYDPFRKAWRRRTEHFRGSVKIAPAMQALALAVAVTWGSASTAQAKEEFPSQVDSDLTLGYQVPCSVCHIKGNTGASTPITPFALSLRDRGLSGDRASLSTALSRLEADGTDSDGDGIGDIAELKAGTDPNSSANANIATVLAPGYGCGGTAPQGHGGPAVAGAIGLALLILRRRRGTA
jgi:MYXO-CTERM domain-containing protein